MASAFHQIFWQVPLNKNRYEEVRILIWPCRVNSNRAETEKERQSVRAQAESLAPVKSGALFSQTYSIETWLLLYVYVYCMYMEVKHMALFPLETVLGRHDFTFGTGRRVALCYPNLQSSN